MTKKQKNDLSDAFINRSFKNLITTGICCLLFVISIPTNGSPKEINVKEKESIKLSLGLDLLTISYKYKFNSPFSLQMDINPILLAGSGIIGRQVYNDIKHEVYIGVGAGFSLVGAAYFYPGLGYRLKLDKSHSLFLEGAIGFYNIFYHGDIGMEKDTLKILRLGYQFSSDKFLTL
tara:strand:- start:412 stop:939 length:528 start_codon:yes stop_codon:yes gene_type:complete